MQTPVTFIGQWPLEVCDAPSFPSCTDLSGERRGHIRDLVVFTVGRGLGRAEHFQGFLEPVLSRVRPAVRVWSGSSTARSRRAGRRRHLDRARTGSPRRARAHELARSSSTQVGREGLESTSCWGSRRSCRLRSGHGSILSASIRVASRVARRCAVLGTRANGPLSSLRSLSP